MIERGKHDYGCYFWEWIKSYTFARTNYRMGVIKLLEQSQRAHMGTIHRSLEQYDRISVRHTNLIPRPAWQGENMVHIQMAQRATQVKLRAAVLIF